MRDSVTFYVKTKNKYVPVSQYDAELMSALPEGVHVVVVRPGLQSYRFKVEQDLVPFMGASDELRRIVCEVLRDALEPKPGDIGRKPTPEQLAAFERAKAAAGGDFRAWLPSRAEIADKVIEAFEAWLKGKHGR